ncbi:unnamed protein product [Polarella glacialis]|uniref:Uncharacterized protein n=1 Tax=Polarella glacialis TaxID=89957 RepID=A0A813JW57_POLGL|nr:unnamed protein product [Polarella glacialis]
MGLAATLLSVLASSIAVFSETTFGEPLSQDRAAGSFAPLCSGLRFHCDAPGGPAPVPCRPASPFNWPALRELLSNPEAAQILADSPALANEVSIAASVRQEHGPACELDESSWVRSKLLEVAAAASPADANRLRLPRARRRFSAPILGSVRPTGWLKGTLERSASGLAGQLFEFYPPVVDSNFVGGQSSYSGLLEDLPYALNGLIPLAAVTGDERLEELSRSAVERVLETSRANSGWLGPDEWPDSMSHSRSSGDDLDQRSGLLSASIWSRLALLQALVQYAEWAGGGPGELGCRCFEAVEAFLLELTRRLDAGLCRLVAWSSARWSDLVLVLNWLNANPDGPRDGTCRHRDIRTSESTGRRLRSMAWIARVQGYDWERWFSDETFPRGLIGRANFSLYSHGVNNAVAIKWGAAWSAVYGSEEAAEYSTRAWKQLLKHHGLPSGAFGADEHLAGPEPHRGTELCVVVESMRSLEEAYAAMPSNPGLADSLEKLAFNALPAAVSDDHWMHQYLTQSNAAYAGIEDLESSTGDDADKPLMSQVFGNVGADATAYGLSPNFPCCTVNFAQGWPKLVALGLWLWDDGGLRSGLGEMPALLSAVFAPSRISLPQPVGGEVELETSYPFAPEGPLRYILRGIRPPFHLLVRVPEWADISKSQVIGPSGEHWPIDVKASESSLGGNAEQPDRPALLSLNIQQKDSVWEVRFALRWMLRPGASWGGSLSLGPLIFAKPLAHQRLALPMDDGPYGPGKHPPAEVRDELLLADPDSWWAWAVIVNGSSGQGLSSSVRMQLGQPSSEGLLAFSTDPLACPLAVHVTAVRWSAWQRMLNASYSVYGPLVLPHPPLDFEDLLPDLDSATELEMKPFGCTRLRMSQLPILASSIAAEQYVSTVAGALNGNAAQERAQLAGAEVGNRVFGAAMPSPTLASLHMQPLGLQAPRGLPMPKPLHLPQLDHCDAGDATVLPTQVQNDLAITGRQLEELTEYAAALSKSLQAERTRAQAGDLAVGLAALAVDLGKAEEIATQLNLWFVDNSAKMKSQDSRTSPSAWLHSSTAELNAQVGALSGRWQGVHEVNHPSDEGRAMAMPAPAGNMAAVAGPWGGAA